MSEDGKSRVLVIGGTRGAGLLIARLLHQRGYQVRVLARNPAAAAAELGPSFEVVAGDLTKPETLPAAVADVDHIIFTAGAPSGRYAPERASQGDRLSGRGGHDCGRAPNRIPGPLRLSQLDRHRDALAGRDADQPAQEEHARLAPAR